MKQLSSVEAIPIIAGEYLLVSVPFTRANSTRQITSDLGASETIVDIDGTDGQGTTLGASDASGGIVVSSLAIITAAETLPDGTEVEADCGVRFAAKVATGSLAVGDETTVKLLVLTSSGQTLGRLIRFRREA